MAGKAHYIFTVSMDVDADKEAIFNEVYDTEHIPLILKVRAWFPRSATRWGRSR